MEREMFKKSLSVLVLLNFVVVLAFVFTYVRHASFVPLYIGLLPFVLCNYIYAREFIAPTQAPVSALPPDQSAKKSSPWGLLIMPVMFCLYLPKLISFENSLGWPPLVSVGFSVLCCLAIISLYGGVKTALKSARK
jgi:hypothetical protein